jgi:hypothetical protein
VGGALEAGLLEAEDYEAADLAPPPALLEAS